MVATFGSFSKLTCRRDWWRLQAYVECGRISFRSLPAEWVLTNRFFDYLRFPLYDRLLALTMNEHGMFLKVARTRADKNYWNSTLNGGLPVVKKGDEIHEGTYLLHDVFHFVFNDPVIRGSETSLGQQAYVAYRMMSEAWTLVLTDMISVALSDIENRGYDTTARRIFPVFKASGLDPRRVSSVEILLRAVSRFALTGDVKGLQEISRGSGDLEAFVRKYSIFFTVDLEWNVHNVANVVRGAQRAPQLVEYVDRLPAPISQFTVADLLRRISDGTALSFDSLFDLFWSKLMGCMAYSRAPQYETFVRRAILKFVAGQIRVAFQYPDIQGASALLEFYEGVSEAAENGTVADLFERVAMFQAFFDLFADHLVASGEWSALDRDHSSLHVRHFPARYISYDDPPDSYTPLTHVSERVFEGNLAVRHRVTDLAHSEADEQLYSAVVGDK